MKKKILLIDDDEDLLRSFQVNLEIFGYVVSTASNSQDGLKILIRDKPDLIVLDVMMNTELEGFNLLHQLKDDPENDKLPILMLTGISSKLRAHLFSADEITKNLPNVRIQAKPVTPLFLVEIIEEMLNE